MKPKRIITNSNPTDNKFISVGNVSPQRAIPNQKAKSKSTKWAFGFRFFNQIRYFEIGGVENGWYISLLDRLREISKIDREEFLKNFSQHGNIRYHKIDWDGINVPIKRSDLNWLDSYYLNNEEEFPILQFHISQALGRVVGFWDEVNVFQIVLLDPMHNIQPSNYNAYHVDDTYFMNSEYSSLLIDIRKIQNKISVTSTCEVCVELVKMPTKLNKTNFVYACLEDVYLEKLSSTNLSLEEVLELGLLQAPDEDAS